MAVTVGWGQSKSKLTVHSLAWRVWVIATQDPRVKTVQGKRRQELRQELIIIISVNWCGMCMVGTLFSVKLSRDFCIGRQIPVTRIAWYCLMSRSRTQCLRWASHGNTTSDRVSWFHVDLITMYQMHAYHEIDWLQLDLIEDRHANRLARSWLDQHVRVHALSLLYSVHSVFYQNNFTCCVRTTCTHTENRVHSTWPCCGVANVLSREFYIVTVLHWKTKF